MYYRYKKEVQSLKYFCHSVNLKVHWKVSEKVPEIRMSVNIHWVFLGLKRESPSCARLRKGANYVCVFAWLCIVFKLTSNWYLNSGDLTILVTSFLLWKTKILYLLSGLFRLFRPEVTYERFKNSLNVWFLFLVSFHCLLEHITIFRSLHTLLKGIASSDFVSYMYTYQCIHQ